jgi:fructokinase
MKDLDVLCLGEALVDLVSDRPGRLSECERFEVHSGGAPANVAVGLARLGVRAAFLGVTGDDDLGSLLARKLAAEGLELHLRRDPAARTGAVLIAVDARGERAFTPIAPGAAHERLAPDDVDRSLLGRARWLHAGTFAHARPDGRAALLAAVKAAHAAGARVSFDPNVRAHAFPDLRDLTALCAEVLPSCDVVKVAADECEVVCREREPERAAQRLEELGVLVSCVTLGEAGALVRQRGSALRVPAERVDVVDTTGAGDGFAAGFLASLVRGAETAGPWPEEALARAARLACHVAGRVCGRLGAVAGLPRLEDVPSNLV